MATEYVIYCDESDDKGQFFSSFYGGVLVRSRDLLNVIEILEEQKTTLNLHGEVKWQKITANYKDKYITLINTFFDLVETGQVKVRVMFTQNIHVAGNLSAYHHEFKYFLLYYQFIKHAFGLVHSTDLQTPVRARLILDSLPDTREKAQLFKERIVSLNRNPQFRRAGIEFTADQIAEVHSHDHVLLQLLDIVLGSIQFRLNDKHKAKEPGARTRGKRTIAKEQVYKAINERIRRVYKNFNIGITTSDRGDVRNRWHDPYRHWRFVPTGAGVDLTRSKQKK